MDTATCCIGNHVRKSWIAPALVTFSLHVGGHAFALPAGGEITAGEATISTPAVNAMQIEQKSSHAIINWSSFGIGRDEAVSIAQPDTRSVLLNRVSGNDPSEIFGTLTANGRIFLVNPNGVLFAPGASINAGGHGSFCSDNPRQQRPLNKNIFYRTNPFTRWGWGMVNKGFVVLQEVCRSNFRLFLCP